MTAAGVTPPPEERKRYDPEQELCPACHAEPGELCADENGMPIPWPHLSRTPDPEGARW